VMSAAASNSKAGDVIVCIPRASICDRLGKVKITGNKSKDDEAFAERKSMEDAINMLFYRPHFALQTANYIRGCIENQAKEKCAGESALAECKHLGQADEDFIMMWVCSKLAMPTRVFGVIAAKHKKLPHKTAAFLTNSSLHLVISSACMNETVFTYALNSAFALAGGRGQDVLKPLFDVVNFDVLWQNWEYNVASVGEGLVATHNPTNTAVELNRESYPSKNLYVEDNYCSTAAVLTNGVGFKQKCDKVFARVVDGPSEKTRKPLSGPSKIFNAFVAEGLAKVEAGTLTVKTFGTIQEKSEAIADFTTPRKANTDESKKRAADSLKKRMDENAKKARYLIG
jgi:hypothetical protein